MSWYDASDLRADTSLPVVARLAIVPERNDIVLLGNEAHTYVSEDVEYEERHGLWEILDDHGEAFIVRFVREETAFGPRGYRYVWTTVGVDNTSFGR